MGLINEGRRVPFIFFFYLIVVLKGGKKKLGSGKNTSQTKGGRKFWDKLTNLN